MWLKDRIIKLSSHVYSIYFASFFFFFFFAVNASLKSYFYILTHELMHASTCEFFFVFCFFLHAL